MPNSQELLPYQKFSSFTKSAPAAINKELQALSAAEVALYHHGYNPATNRDTARICFNAIRPYLAERLPSEALAKDGEGELVELLKEFRAAMDMHGGLLMIAPWANKIDEVLARRGEV